MRLPAPAGTFPMTVESAIHCEDSLDVLKNLMVPLTSEKVAKCAPIMVAIDEPVLGPLANLDNAGITRLSTVIVVEEVPIC